jgi:hypothetical protein
MEGGNGSEVREGGKEGKGEMPIPLKELLSPIADGSRINTGILFTTLKFNRTSPGC